MKIYLYEKENHIDEKEKKRKEKRTEQELFFFVSKPNGSAKKCARFFLMIEECVRNEVHRR